MVLLLAFTTVMGVAQAPAIDGALAAHYFDEARALSQTDAGALWGVELYGPMIFVDPATGAGVINHPPPAAHREAFARVGRVWRGPVPPDVGIANTAVDWGDERWTMIMWPLPANRYARASLLLHELYHRVQPRLGMPGLSPENPHLDEADARVLLRLEWRALEAALLRSDGARIAALQDALRFRRQRHSRFPEAARSEAALELNEGLAAYTGLAASGLPMGVQADRAAVILAEYDGRESLSRSFAYASGPAYGVLLDEARARWRESIGPASDLGALVAEAYGIEGVEVKSGSAATNAGVDVDAPYGEWRLRAEERDRAERIEAQRADLTARFIDGPTLTLPVVGDFGYSFNPNDASVLPGAGTVYGSARVRAAWGVLEVESGGVLMERVDGSIVRVVVPVPTDAPGPPLAVEGWTLELADGWAVVRGLEGGWRVEAEAGP